MPRSMYSTTVQPPNRKFPDVPIVVRDCLPEEEEDKRRDPQRLRRPRPRGVDVRAGRAKSDGEALLIVSNEVSSTTTIWLVE
jgi:hypothetical protein